MITLISSAVVIIQSINLTSIYGGRGNYYLLTARPLTFSSFSFDMMADYYYELYTDSSATDVFEDRRHFGNGWLNIVFAPIDYVEIYINGAGFVRYDEKKEKIEIPVEIREDAYSFGQRAIGGGAKVGIPVFSASNGLLKGYLGGKAGIWSSFAPPESDTVMINRGFPPLEHHNPDYDLRFLTGVEFGALGLNFNGGYIMRGSDRVTGFDRKDEGIYGVSLDLNVRDRIWLFTEGFQLGDSAFYTAGLKLGIGSNFSFNVFMLRGLTDSEKWKVAAGVSVFSITPPGERGKPKAYIAGRVIDSKNGAPILAIISFPGSNVQSVMTNTDGTFRVGLPAGAYMIYVQASGYRPKERPITVKKGSEMIYDLMLTPDVGYRSEPVGRISGNIFDEREEPIDGEVDILGADIPHVRTKDGRFDFEVAPGRYEITAHAPGYKPYSKVIYVKEEGKKVQADIYLKEEPMTAPAGFGKISGFIRDKETEIPVFAKVSAGGIVNSTDNMGYYEIDVASGSPQIVVEANDYVAAKRYVDVKKGSDIILDLFLAKKKPTGIIIGSVYEYENNDPVFAQISVDGETKKITHNNLETGIFQVEASPGKYLVTASAAGFKSRVKEITLQENAIEVLTFYVVKSEKTTVVATTTETQTFRPIYFDYGSTYYRYEYHSYLADIANYLNKNSSEKIEIRGYTDSVGPDFQNTILSQRRAETVRDYLISQGIEPSRIFARGYGESFPVGDNRTLSGRELNRRVEFRILP